MEDYKMMEKLGHGSYGHVYKAQKLKSEEETYVALKKINSSKKKTIETEVAFLKELKHENIINFEDYFYGDQYTGYLVFELMDTDLRSYLNNNYSININENIIKNFLLQIMKGINFCHDKSIIHRDLKPENILIKNNSILKIADFGLSMSLKDQNNRFSTNIGTIPYKAPEMSLNKRPYGFYIDIWSIGCIFAELLTRRILFCSLTEDDHLRKVFSILGSPIENSWPEFKNLTGYLNAYSSYKESSLNKYIPNLNDCSQDLITKMFTFYPEKRITGIEILNHAYLKNVHI